MGKATQDLREEHAAILRVLEIVNKMMTADLEDIDRLRYYTEVVYFFQIFADKCHHGKEERYLFVELVENGVASVRELVGLLAREHNQGRDYVASMNRSLKSSDFAEFDVTAGKYRDLLHSHIEKEEDLLFPMADHILGEEKQDALFEEFERYEEKVIGHGVHEELHSMIDKWSDTLRER